MTFLLTAGRDLPSVTVYASRHRGRDRQSRRIAGHLRDDGPLAMCPLLLSPGNGEFARNHRALEFSCVHLSLLSRADTLSPRAA